MSFTAPKFTTAGKALQARALAGTALQFTTMKIGDGTMPTGATIENMTSLISTKVTIPISSIKRSSDSAIVKGSFTNQSETSGFYWREIGLFAADPSFPADRAHDILYCYQNAGSLAEYIPSASSEVIEKVISIAAVVSDAETVTAIIQLGAFATSDDLEEHVDDAVAHVTAEERTTWNGKAPAADLTAHVGDTTKHITAAERTTWNGKQAALTFDTKPTAGSTNPVTSGGVKSAMVSHEGNTTKHITGAERTAWNAKAKNTDLTAHVGDTTKHITAAERTTWNGKQAALTFDATPTAGSSNPVTSGGVKSAMTSHETNTTKHITAEERTAWNGKAAGAHTHSKSDITDFPTAMTPTAHTQGAATITEGRLSGKVSANFAATATLANPQVRDIHAGTYDMVAGLTSLMTGALYIFYE